MGIFFIFDICVGALAYGISYFRTPAAWINIMAVGATGVSFLPVMSVSPTLGS